MNACTAHACMYRYILYFVAPCMGVAKATNSSIKSVLQTVGNYRMGDVIRMPGLAFYDVCCVALCSYNVHMCLCILSEIYVVFCSALHRHGYVHVHACTYTFHEVYLVYVYIAYTPLSPSLLPSLPLYTHTHTRVIVRPSSC